MSDQAVMSRARVLYDYDAKRDDELSICYGDELDVRVKEGNGWWLANNQRGQSGLVPSNYLVELPATDSDQPAADGQSSDAAPPSTDVFADVRGRSIPKPPSVPAPQRPVVGQRPDEAPGFKVLAETNRSTDSQQSQQHSGLSDSRAAWAMAAVAEIHAWEQVEADSRQAVEPIVAEYGALFDSLCSSYLHRLRSALPAERLAGRLDAAALLHAEHQRLQAANAQLFSAGHNGLLQDISAATQRHSRLAAVTRAALRIQAVWRGYAARRQYRKKLRKRRRRTLIAQELEQNEGRYIALLEFLHDDCRRRIEDANYQCLQQHQAPLCSPALLPRIFLNVAELLQTHRRFHADVQQVVCSPAWDPHTSLLSPAVLRHVPAFTACYTVFIEGIDAAIASLQEASQASKELAQLLQVLKLHPRSTGQLLDSLLVTPVSRLPRIGLLVSELLKHTKPSHPDHAGLQRARDELKLVAQRVNESKRRHDERQQVAKLQQLFDPPLQLETPSRELVMQAQMHTDSLTLLPAGSSSSSKQSFAPVRLMLFSDCLLVASPLGKKLRLSEMMALRRVKVKPATPAAYPPGAPFAFSVQLANRRPDKFFVASKDDADRWLQAIQDAKLMHDGDASPAAAHQPATAPAVAPLVRQPSAAFPVASSPPSTDAQTVLLLFREVLAVESALFQLPVAVQQLLPGLCQQLPPDHLAQLAHQIEALGGSLGLLDQARARLAQLMRAERQWYSVESAVQQGTQPIDALKLLVQQYCPAGQQAEHPLRTALKQLIIWYQTLVVAWSQFKTTPLQ